MTEVVAYEDLGDYEEIKDYLGEDPAGMGPGAEFNFTPDLRCALAVDGFPVITPDKKSKLVQVLAKKFASAVNITDDDVYIPLDSSGQSMGFAFMRFNSPEEAEMMLKLIDGAEFSKKHILSASLYSDLARYAQVPEEYKDPEPTPFVPRPNPASWLTDSQFRDQFVVRYSTQATQETEIWWSNMDTEPSIAYNGEDQKESGKNWCERQVEWSPRGTYLSTFHPRGVVLWGGERFQRCGRFEHASVESLAFSADENHVVTYKLREEGGASSNQSIIVWNVREARKIRGFALKDAYESNMMVQLTDKANNKTLFGKITWDEEHRRFTIDCGGKDQYRGVMHRVESYGREDRTFDVQEGPTTGVVDVRPLSNPNVLKWSYDGQYLARLGGDIITVYELPSMNILDKKSIAAAQVVDFEWSPTSNVIAYWALGLGNSPSRVTMVRIPSRQEIPGRNLFGVSEGRLHWQDQGEYLCVQMLKPSGKKGATSPRLMIFRVNEPAVPVEQVDLEEPIINLSWEPSGHRFAVVCGDRRQQSVHFYSMWGAGNKKELTHLSTIGGGDKLGNKHLSQFDAVHWSPAGSTALLAFYQQEGLLFDIYDADNKTFMTEAVRRHDLGKQILWDPSGRLFASVAKISSANLKADLDFGYAIYTFQGEPVCRVRKDNLSQFAWRPRPKDLLTQQQRAEIARNLNQYKKRFEKEDRERRQARMRQFNRERRRLARDLLGVIQRGHERYVAARPQRLALYNGYDSEDDRHYVFDTEVIETVLGVQEEVTD